MNSSPPISVLMSVYNGMPYLPKSIESILNQTHGDFEFIIIDDGSDDSSAEVIRNYAQQDRRIRFISQDNIGLTRALNNGLKEVKGKYLARMDDDDIALPDRFEKQYEFMEKNPEFVVIGGQVLLIDEQGKLLRNFSEGPVSNDAGLMQELWLEHHSIEDSLLSVKWQMIQGACLFQMNAVKEVEGYNPAFRTNQDHDLFLRLARVGLLGNLPDVVVKYRRHGTQITRNTQGRNFNAILTMKRIRRAAYKKRGMILPKELRLASILGTLSRRELSNLPGWRLIQRIRRKVNRDG